ncbi:N-ribosylnicotinamide CRP-like regulator [Bacillus sp. JCM 19046]|nr:N-ribosylnicotinamide CRP-like regulator [Bacillus sp. JCM 19046]
MMRKEQEQIEQFLLDHQLEGVVPEPLQAQASILQLKKGDSVCVQGEIIVHLYLLVKGRIKIYKNSPQGRTLILCYKDPVEAIGDIEYIQKKPVINTVEAVSDGAMLLFPYAALDAHGRESAVWMRFLLEVVTKKFYIDTDVSSFQLLHPVEARLVRYLLAATEEKVKTKELADVLGTSYRHLNRVIKKLEQKQLICRERGMIQIYNQQRLQQLVEELEGEGSK